MKTLLLLFLTICYNINSQVGWTFDRVVKELGKEYEFLAAKDCYFDSCIEYDYGTSFSTLGFMEEKGVKQCHYVGWYESIKEANKWINMMKERNYVEVGDLTWRDYATGVEHKITLYSDKGRLSYYKYFWE